MGRTGVGTLCLWLCAVVCLVHGQNYVNVARDKTYNQSNKLASQGPSSNAANGDTSGIYPANCIHTYGHGDWWEVDLGETYAVHSITVWERTNFKQRLYPSIITVDDHTCASITSFPTDTREKTVTCSSVMYGRTVRITRQPTPQQSGDDRTLNLCEMEIWGCVSGWYGDQCSTACSPGCQDTCNLQIGNCSCKTGYTGDKCAECVSGWYGDQCSTACSPGCQDTLCNQQSGNCSCNAGYTGATCTECEDTYYNTSSGTCVQCSANCLSQSCEDQTGKCNGCVSGWYGDQCSTACSPGCQDTTCDQKSGQCSCKAGYTGVTCTECKDTYYNTSSGTCVQCSTNCLSQGCEHQTGKCNGCVSGWYGDQCSTACSPGCQDTCDQQSGYCSCNDGHTGDTCTDCVDGYYKQSDNTRCDACRGTCQSGTVCDKTTGFCPLCPPDKQGDYCEQVKKDNDETVNTPVIIGAVVGAGLFFIGVCIIILAVVLWVLRSRRTSRQNRTTTDKPEVTASPESARPAADREQVNAVFHGVLDGEEHYESVGDIPMTTKHVHPFTSIHPDTTTTHVPPGTSTHPDSTAHVTEADSPYDLPAEQYSNTGELHLYDPWRVSRAAQLDDDIDMAAHSDHKGKVSGEKVNVCENSN